MTTKQIMPIKSHSQGNIRNDLNLKGQRLLLDIWKALIRRQKQIIHSGALKTAIIPKPPLWKAIIVWAGNDSEKCVLFVFTSNSGNDMINLSHTFAYYSFWVLRNQKTITGLNLKKAPAIYKGSNKMFIEL